MNALPEEILLLIFQYFQLRGKHVPAHGWEYRGHIPTLCSLTCVSRAYHRIALPLLYRGLEVNSALRCCRLVRTFTARSDLACLARDLEIGFYSRLDDTSRPTTNGINASIGRATTLANAIPHEYLEKIEDELVKSTQSDALIASLLMLVPRIELLYLAIPGWKPDAEPLVPVLFRILSGMEVITNQGLRPAAATRWPAGHFENLKTVHIQQELGLPNAQSQEAALPGIITLPALLHLSCKFPCNGLLIAPGGCHSNVTRLTLTGTATRSLNWMLLFSLCPKLRWLEVHWQSESDPVLVGFDSALRIHNQRLEVLHTRADYWNIIYEPAEYDLTVSEAAHWRIGSIKELKRLRHLYIAPYHLAGYPWGGEDVPVGIGPASLQDSLPSSLESLYVDYPVHIPDCVRNGEVDDVTFSFQERFQELDEQVLNLLSGGKLPKLRLICLPTAPLTRRLEGILSRREPCPDLGWSTLLRWRRDFKRRVRKAGWKLSREGGFTYLRRKSKAGYQLDRMAADALDKWDSQVRLHEWG